MVMFLPFKEKRLVKNLAHWPIFKNTRPKESHVSMRSTSMIYVYKLGVTFSLVWHRTFAKSNLSKLEAQADHQ